MFPIMKNESPLDAPESLNNKPVKNFISILTMLTNKKTLEKYYTDSH